MIFVSVIAICKHLVYSYKTTIVRIIYITIVGESPTDIQWGHDMTSVYVGNTCRNINIQPSIIYGIWVFTGRGLAARGMGIGLLRVC